MSSVLYLFYCISFVSFWRLDLTIIQAGTEFMIFLSLPSKCCSSSCALANLACILNNEELKIPDTDKAAINKF